MLSAMGGTLIRHPEGWRWRDGRPEARVRDVTALEAFAFPTVTRADPEAPGGRARFLAIPRGAAAEEPELREAIAMAGARAIEPEDDPGVIEVPWSLWEPWAKTQVIGLRWDAADEADLIREAEALRAR